MSEIVNEKWIQYASDLVEKIQEFCDENQDELLEDENLTHFIYALSVVTPTRTYSSITGNNVNYLEFNHIANKLCFQFMKPNKDK